MARKSTVTQPDAEAPVPEPAWYQHVGWWVDEPEPTTRLLIEISEYGNGIEWAVVPGHMLMLVAEAMEFRRKLAIHDFAITPESIDYLALQLIRFKALAADASDTDTANEAEVVAKEIPVYVGDTASLARELLVELVRAKQVVSDQFVDSVWSVAEKFMERARRMAEAER